jgi:hypothetical protein
MREAGAYYYYNLSIANVSCIQYNLPHDSNLKEQIQTLALVPSLSNYCKIQVI